jgi:arylsulfatase A-like enzyme
MSLSPLARLGGALRPLHYRFRATSAIGRPPANATPPTLLALTLWFGLIAGLLELGAMFAQNTVVDLKMSFAWARTSRHFIWMIPVASVALLGGCGALLAAFRRRSPRREVLLLAFVTFVSPLLVFRGINSTASAILALGLATQAARLVHRHPAGFRRVVRLTLPPLAGVVVLLIGLAANRALFAEARGVRSLPAAAPAAPNVVLLVLDTVRADHTSLHGYHRDTTPNLARLARRGVRFDWARSTAPWTLPSHASMFTGRWLHEHGASRSRALDASHETLAEFLRDHGYITGGFVANSFFCCARFGLDQGFHRYEDFPETTRVTPVEVMRSVSVSRFLLGLVDRLFKTRVGIHGPLRKDAARINRDALAWLPRDPGRPFFLFINYFDAHAPYHVPPGGDRRFGLVPESPRDRRMLEEWDRSDRSKLSPRDHQLAFDGYDDCIAYLDAQVGHLLEALNERGQLRDTIVIVTSDHGEAFGEHGVFGHSQSLYRPELHVPLLIVDPRGTDAGRVVREPVSLRDIPATVATLTGLEPSAPFPGRSLVTPGEPDGGEPVTPILSESVPSVSFPFSNAPSKRGPMHALVSEGRVYIHNADGREELYDAETDPDETSDLAGSADSRDVLKRLREVAERARQAAGIRR